MEQQPNQPQPSVTPPTQQVQMMENPGQTLGIIGLVLNFLGITLGGIILGAMSRSKSKAVGMSTTLGTISLVWGIVVTVLTILAIVFFVVVAVMAASNEPSMTSSI